MRPAFDSRLLGWLTQPRVAGQDRQRHAQLPVRLRDHQAAGSTSCSASPSPPSSSPAALILIGLTSVVIVAPHAAGGHHHASAELDRVVELGRQLQAALADRPAWRRSTSARSRQLLDRGTYDASASGSRAGRRCGPTSTSRGTCDYLATAPTQIDLPVPPGSSAPAPGSETQAPDDEAAAGTSELRIPPAGAGTETHHPGELTMSERIIPGGLPGGGRRRGGS